MRSSKMMSQASLALLAICAFALFNEAYSTNQDVLHALDEQEGFKLFHLKACFVAGSGFLADAYDLFVISLLTRLIGRIYYPDTSYWPVDYCKSLNVTHVGDIPHSASNIYQKYPKCGTNWDKGKNLHKWLNDNKPGWTLQDALYHAPSAIPSNTDSALKGVALVGTLCGQLIFGYLGDRFGRKSVYAVTLIIMIGAAVGSAMSYGMDADGVIGTLCTFRFLLGVGIGGDYPLSATIMSEYASRKNRGMWISAVFANQGLGYLIAGTVTIIASSIWLGHDSAGDYLWRTVLVLGAIPPATTLYSRLMLPETARYTALVADNAAKVAADMEKVLGTHFDESVQQNMVAKKHSFTNREFLKKFGWTLFGCASTWFLLDIAFYSQNMFQGDVFTATGWLGPSYTMTGVEETWALARAQLIISLASTIPGYFVTVATIECMGRIKIQVLGFVVMTMCMGILAGKYDTLKHDTPSFVVLYALCFFFANWGPNSITFVLPAELFPARIRATAHGFCAAVGKAGAIIGVFGFGALKDTPTPNAGLQTALGVLTAINFVGLLCTYPIPEPLGLSLEDLGEEFDKDDTSKVKDPSAATPPAGQQQMASIQPLNMMAANGSTSVSSYGAYPQQQPHSASMVHHHHPITSGMYPPQPPQFPGAYPGPSAQYRYGA